MKGTFLFVLLLFGVFPATAQDIIKIMFYNLLEFLTALPGDRATILQNVLNEHGPDTHSTGCKFLKIH